MISRIQTFLEKFFNNYSDEVLALVAILIGAWVVKRFGIVVIRKFVRDSLKRHKFESDTAEKQREDTIIQIISNALNILIGPIALIMVIGQFGVDIAPLLAGAGILGVALGFGSQSLVKDIISGLFIVIENQYRVGDVIEVNGAAGKVERITLRITVLRDLDGIVHYVPNGTVEVVSNMSMDYSGINIDVGVGYESDINQVKKIVNDVGQKLAADKQWGDKIIEAPSFFRVDELGDSAIIVKITGKVLPLQQWAVAGEMRQRIKEAFDDNGIDIPFPQQVLHQVKE